jgi:epoxyqueuosine reductase
VNRNSANRAEISADIRRRAVELGFSKVGIVRAETLSVEHSRLREWLGRGFHGEMKWMERDPQQRTDPRRIFPAARSVVVVALNYYTPHQHGVSTTRVSERRVRTESDSDRIKLEVKTTCEPSEVLSTTGKVSRYAWGDDYHEIAGDKLRELLSWTKAQWPQTEGKVCVDIQPMMDKAWAVRAGLGWIGKHTNVITKEYGSWVFIGELLLNLELAYDEIQVADQCGSCTLCIDACPTGAIVEPYVLNSNLCISHATIESRAPEIADEVATNLEGWLYGCDICQDVCPWNQMTPETTESRFEPRAGNVDASLADILQLTPEAYAERFRRSAMKRAKLSGLQRNARTLIESSPRARTSIDS